jgi:hypothetical protein
MDGSSANLDLVGGATINRDIAFFGVWSKSMSLGEVQSQQFRPHNSESCVQFSLPGLHGTGAIPDLSGRGNNATVSGLALAAGVPVQLFPPAPTWMPYVVAAAVGRTTKNTDPYGLGIAPGISRTFKIGGL